MTLSHLGKKKSISDRIRRELDINLDRHGEKLWNVSVYRFQAPIFDDVLTTASISIIDKGTREGQWSYYNVLPDLSIQSRTGISGADPSILPHASRGDIWARRGLSTGSQRIFTLTETERIQAGLTEDDVLPCVTTMRTLSTSIRDLNQGAFKKNFVKAGRRCWLLRSADERLSNRVKRYLDGIPEQLRQTYTCLNQEPWYAYEQAPVPKLLFHSGFTAFGPKIVVNSVGAQAVGSVYGIHGPSKLPVRELQKHLLSFDFENRVVAHAKTLRKVEVRQLNSVLSSWVEEKR